ncbi:MAG: response regulator [Deltaproteobacteria bacterium]|nr:MAG: response regulator [Deltaproteobacteria bacterium]TMQ14813.1 MAG: response regulator [Deltaproteobacteria bacterium]
MSPRVAQVIGRVLLADDDAGVRAAMVASLRRAGFEITAVDDGAPAIALAEPLRFEIVLVDLHMKTSGVAVIRHYKQRYGAGVYCAVLSGEDDDETRTICMAAGADEVFCKPVPASVLRRWLTEVALSLRARGASERSA